jgi:double-strand break repair protein MRE11
MDVLSVSNLVNYIGKCEQVDDIEITPLLLRKGNTMIALYALGAVRDERLNRMWTQKHVKFLRPREDQGRERFLNIFVLHQNRDYGRGSKNCVHESMIPDWMDVVIWGNEHECVPNLVESLVGTFRIYQPGSSIATSLCEGESSKYPKHFGMLEINLEKFRLVTFPYTQIRSFTFADLSLSEEGLDPREPNIEEAINTLLTRKIKEIIREARRNLNDQRSNNLSISSSSLQDQPRYEIKEPQKVLIKLRVDHSGFPTINQQRFGTQFLGEVANPSDLILLTRKRRESERANPSAVRTAGFEALRISGDAEALSRVRVEDLVNEALEASHKQLGILTPGLDSTFLLPPLLLPQILLVEQLSNALEDFVLKKIPSAIGDTIEHALNITQSYLSSDKDVFELCTDKEAILKSAAKFREDAIQSGATSAVPRSVTTRPTSSRAVARDDDMELQDDDDEDDSVTNQSSRGGRGGRGRGRGGTSAGRTTSSTRAAPKPRATAATTTTAKATRGRGRAKATSYRIDDDDEEEEEEAEFDDHSDDEEEEFPGAELQSEESFDEISDSDGRESKRKGKGKAKAVPKPKVAKAAPPKKPAAATRAPAKKVVKEKPVVTPRATTSSSTGTRILASGRSQRKSQMSQLSMTSTTEDIENDDSEEERYLGHGKRSRYGLSISQQSEVAVDLTGDAEDAWASTTKKTPISSSSGAQSHSSGTNNNSSSTTSTRRPPPTQLKW